MTVPFAPAYGALALVVAALLIVAILVLSVRFRAFTGRGRGVRVYDLAADLNLPPMLHTRGYQFALYLTMKSLPRETV